MNRIRFKRGQKVYVQSYILFDRHIGRKPTARELGDRVGKITDISINSKVIPGELIEFIVIPEDSDATIKYFVDPIKGYGGGWEEDKYIHEIT